MKERNVNLKESKEEYLMEDKRSKKLKTIGFRIRNNRNNLKRRVISKDKAEDTKRNHKR